MNGFRYVQNDGPAGLQLFFLSLLWRAGASELPEFAGVTLDHETLEDVRQRVLHQAIGDYADYPVWVFQMVIRGAPHNCTPMFERKPMVPPDASESPDVIYARFYFDGLVAHVHLGCGIQW